MTLVECRAGLRKAMRRRSPSQIWLFVEGRKRRTGLSANRICNTSAFHFRVAGYGGMHSTHVMDKATLRHRYQIATRMLKAEQEREEFTHALRRVGASSPIGGHVRQRGGNCWWA